MQSGTNTTVLVASKYLGSRHVRDRATKAALIAHTQTCVARWETAGNLGTNPHTYSHFVLGTDVKNTQPLQPEETVKLHICVYKSETRSPSFFFFTKVNSKCIKDLTVRPRSLKLVEENIEKKNCRIEAWVIPIENKPDSSGNTTKN